MTAPTPNAELAYKILDHIDAHPEQWDQGHWYGATECGTTACFAGWAVSLSGHKITLAKPDWDGFMAWEAIDGDSDVSVARVAERDLGIAGMTEPCTLCVEDPCGDIAPISKRLFKGANTREDLGRLVAEIFGPCPEPAPVDHSACDHGGKQVRCDRCRTEYVCTPARDFYCTPEGDHCCEPCLLAGVGTTEMHVIDLTESHTFEPPVGEEMQPPPCADHEASELGCPVCTAQRRAFYAALGRDLGGAS